MHIGKMLVLVTLLAVATPATAQYENYPQHPGCKRLNSSRLPAPECGLTRPPIILSHELLINTNLSAPPIKSLDCQASVVIRYLQSDTIAKVDGTIENESCAASSGSFVLSISTSDAAGKLTTWDYSQAWMREDDQPLAFTGDYDIGKNVDLVRVRALRIVCKCQKSKK